MIYGRIILKRMLQACNVNGLYSVGRRYYPTAHVCKRSEYWDCIEVGNFMKSWATTSFWRQILIWSAVTVCSETMIGNVADIVRAISYLSASADTTSNISKQLCVAYAYIHASIVTHNHFFISFNNVSTKSNGSLSLKYVSSRASSLN